MAGRLDFRKLGAILDEVCVELTSEYGYDRWRRKALARRIIELSVAGETDPERLKRLCYEGADGGPVRSKRGLHLYVVQDRQSAHP